MKKKAQSCEVFGTKKAAVQAATFCQRPMVNGRWKSVLQIDFEIVIINLALLYF
ncbi:hypothetical protein [Acidaminococcus sp. DS4831]|uniref:hypothetical protein n=1 Tax=Acidaminococcus sp. DS4831 TaxID=3141399 RepID=UPI0032E43BAC